MWQTHSYRINMLLNMFMFFVILYEIFAFVFEATTWFDTFAYFATLIAFLLHSVKSVLYALTLPELHIYALTLPKLHMIVLGLTMLVLVIRGIVKLSSLTVNLLRLKPLQIAYYSIDLLVILTFLIILMYEANRKQGVITYLEYPTVEPYKQNYE